MPTLPELVYPGVWCVPTPLPFGPPEINSYLVETEDGWLLIDTGIDAAVTLQSIAQTGISPHRIQAILVSHIHPDHSAAALSLQRACNGAPLWMHRLESDLSLFLSDRGAATARLAETMHRSGVAIQTQEAILKNYQRLLHVFPRLEPDCALQDGTQFETSIGPLCAVVTPGHSPGHICLYAPQRRLLFSGDHLLETITPHIGWLPGYDSLGDYLATVDRLAELEVDLVFPSHGRPFAQHRNVLARAPEHHAARCGAICAWLSRGTETAAELIEKLWPRELPALDYQLALLEVLAHLVYLEKRDMIRRVRRDDAVEVWQLISGNSQQESGVFSEQGA